MRFAVYATRTKVHHRYPDFSDKQTGWLEAHHCVTGAQTPGVCIVQPTPGAQRAWTIQMLWKSVGKGGDSLTGFDEEP